MSNLEKKAEKRSFTNTTKKKKSNKKEPTKIIIGEAASKGPFVKEQTIKLKPVGERGKGPGSQPGAGVTIGSRTNQKGKKKHTMGVVGGRSVGASR